MKKEYTYEQAVGRLEEIVKKLEGGEITLDESLALYEEGVKLVKFCNAALDRAEQKVAMLVRGEDGQMGEVPFSPAEEDRD